MTDREYAFYLASAILLGLLLGAAISILILHLKP